MLLGRSVSVSNFRTIRRAHDYAVARQEFLGFEWDLLGEMEETGGVTQNLAGGFAVYLQGPIHVFTNKDTAFPFRIWSRL